MKNDALDLAKTIRRVMQSASIDWLKRSMSDALDAWIKEREAAQPESAGSQKRVDVELLRKLAESLDGNMRNMTAKVIRRAIGDEPAAKLPFDPGTMFVMPEKASDAIKRGDFTEALRDARAGRVVAHVAEPAAPSQEQEGPFRSRVYDIPSARCQCGATGVIRRLDAVCVARDADAEVEKLRARVAELEAAPAWLPIDSAPKDGTAVLGYEPGSGCEVCKWMENLREWTDCHGSVIRARWWMPIPDLPTLKAEAPGSRISTGSVLRAGLRENEELRARVAELKRVNKRLHGLARITEDAASAAEKRVAELEATNRNLQAECSEIKRVEKARADAAEADATEGGAALLDIARRCAEAIGSAGPDHLGPQRGVLAVIERMKAAEAKLAEDCTIRRALTQTIIEAIGSTGCPEDLEQAVERLLAKLAALGENPIRRDLVERWQAHYLRLNVRFDLLNAILAGREPGVAS